VVLQENSFLRGSQVSDSGLRLGRVVKILRILVQQFDILETMDAQAFHDFRTRLNHPFYYYCGDLW